MNDAVLRFLVEVTGGGIGKLESELKSLALQGTATAASTTKSGSEATRALNRIAQSEASAAKRSVENAAARHALIRRQIADYQAIGRAAVKGSDEQIAANLLAEKAQRRLARETGVAATETAVAYGRAGTAARHYERDVNRIGRGILSGSGLLRGATRVAAFGSTAFLGGVGASFALRSIVEESAKAQSVQQALRTQLAASGISWQKYGAELDIVAAKEAHLAGVDEKDVQGALTQLIRTTGSVAASEKLLGLTLDISAGRHISLSTAAGLVSRVFAGNLGILKRYGIVLGSDVKTPLEALIALQAKFAGQAEAAGETTSGAFGRAKNSLHVFEEGLGAGILPVLTDRLNALTGTLDDQALKQKAEELGKTIATNVDGAITTIVRDVKENWPAIKQDFHDAERVLSLSAVAAERVASALAKIASVVPDQDSLIALLLGRSAVKKIAEKLPGAAEKKGLGLWGEVEAGATGAAARAIKSVPKLERFAKGSLEWGGLGVEGMKSLKLTPELAKGLGISPEEARRWHLDASAIRAVDEAAGKSKDKIHELIAEHMRAEQAARGWNAVKDALKATGAGLDQQKTKLEQIVKEEQAAARAAAQSLDQAFSTLTSDIGNAFDSQTQRMLDNVSYRVRVVGQGIEEAFTLRGDELTPAERELAALDKLQQRRTYKRDIFDAKQELAAAKQSGDPVLIRQAERKLQDAETEKRRAALEKRAALERKAADAAKAEAQKQLQARRDLEKRQLDDQLAALLKRAENGKLAGKAVVKAVLGVLNQHGIDFKNAGALLGTAFSTELKQDLDLVRGHANKVADAFDRIGATKAKIKALAGEVAKLAAELARIQGRGPLFTGTGGPGNKTGKYGGPGGHAEGGVVEGPLGRDVIPAMLTRDELVLNEDQQGRLKRALGLSGGPRELFQHIRGFAEGGVVGRFDSGGIAKGESFEAWLLRLTRQLARLDRDQFRGHNRAVRHSHPVHIEHLVAEALGARGERRLGKIGTLRLEQKLAQEQAHPFLEGLLRAPPTGTELGAAARTGRALPQHRLSGLPAGAFGGKVTVEVPIYLDGQRIGFHTREVLLKQSQRGYVRKRGAGAGSNVGLT